MNELINEDFKKENILSECFKVCKSYFKRDVINNYDLHSYSNDNIVMSIHVKKNVCVIFDFVISNFKIIEHMYEVNFIKTINNRQVVMDKKRYRLSVKDFKNENMQTKWLSKYDHMYDSNNYHGAKYLGHVYVVYFKDCIKIGSTSNILRRVKSISSTLKNYADKKMIGYIYTIPHTNYRKIETYLHNYFKENKINNGEMYDITIDEFMEKCPEILLETEVLDKIQNAGKFVNTLKNFILNKN